MLASFRKESASPPSALIQARNEASVASDFTEVVSFAAVDLIAFEMADLCSFAGEKGIGLPVSKGFTRAGPKPIDNRLRTSLWRHTTPRLVSPHFELRNPKPGFRR